MSRRSLAETDYPLETEYPFWWVDGIYTTLRESDDPRRSLWTIIFVLATLPKSLQSKAKADRHAIWMAAA